VQQANIVTLVLDGVQTFIQPLVMYAYDKLCSSDKAKVVPDSNIGQMPQNAEYPVTSIDMQQAQNNLFIEQAPQVQLIGQTFNNQVNIQAQYQPLQTMPMQQGISMQSMPQMMPAYTAATVSQQPQMIIVNSNQQYMGVPQMNMPGTF
jgi:hypothetical protein